MIAKVCPPLTSRALVGKEVEEDVTLTPLASRLSRRRGTLRRTALLQEHSPSSSQRRSLLPLGEEEEEEGPDGGDGGGGQGAAVLLQPPQRGRSAQTDTQHPGDAPQAHQRPLRHALRR